MLTRFALFVAVVAVLAVAGAPAEAADTETAQVQAPESISAVNAGDEAEVQAVGKALPEDWAAEREMVAAIRAEAAGRIAAIEARLTSPDLSDAERADLCREIGDLKINSEISVQEIRLAVAEDRGMTREAQEIRRALENLRNLDAPRETGTVDRAAEQAPVVPQAVPGEPVKP
jgi:hypothetical protein